MIVYAASRRTHFVHSAVLNVTSLRPLGIVLAVLFDGVCRGRRPRRPEYTRMKRGVVGAAPYELVR